MGGRMSKLTEEVVDYLKDCRYVFLTTVGEDGYSDIRSVGGYSLDETGIYIVTVKNSNKVEQILKHPEVLVFAQKENQTIPDFQNITLYGKASVLSGEEEAQAKALIEERKGGLNLNQDGRVVLKVEVERGKKLDFRREPGQQKTEII